MADYSALEAVLGYPFKDGALLEQALRHPSWCNEQNEPRGLIVFMEEWQE